jgi:signal transduction histidine kinase
MILADSNTKKTYTIALTIVFLLLLGSQILVQYFLYKQTHDAEVINIAGRQRMRSQKIVKLILYLKSNSLDNNAKKELLQTINTFKTSHPYIEGKTEIGGFRNINTEKEKQLIKKVNQSYVPLIACIEEYLIAVKKDSLLEQILKFEKAFLPDMDDLVNAYQVESINKIKRLKISELVIFILTILLLLFEIIVIFMPLIRKLQSANQFLEQTSEVAKTGGWEYLNTSKKIKLSIQSMKILNLEKNAISLHSFCELFDNQKGLEAQIMNDGNFETELHLIQLESLKWIYIKKMTNKISSDKHKVYGIIKDITVEKENEIYQNVLEERNDGLLKLNYGLTHDIKNHTANVLGLLNMLKKYEQKQQYEKLKAILVRAEYSANQLNQILSDFLYLSRSKEELEKSFNLINEKKIVNAIEAEIQFVKLDKSVTIKYDFNVGQVIYSDHIIKIILVNLISNSIKYSKSNLPCIVEVNVKKVMNQLHISVSDNGIGMDLNNSQNKIFNLFGQLNDDNQGHGIGLSVIKKILDQQNGKIDVDSTLDVGTTFNIYIPLVKN